MALAINGILISLQRNISNNGELIILVQDGFGTVFGGFMTHSFELRDNFFGTGECFVFKFKDQELYVYHATTANNLYCFADEDGFGMGSGGRYGLFIDKELKKGASYTCKTYNNEVLSDDHHFKIFKLEIWGFMEKDM